MPESAVAAGLSNGATARSAPSEGEVRAGVPLLSIRSLSKHFPIRNTFGFRTGWLKALDEVSLDIWPGETVGLVGESGCGKSTLGKTVMGIHAPTDGSIVFEGEEIAKLPSSRRGTVGKDLQYVYQDPGASLDPRWKIRRSLHEPLVIQTKLSRAERESRVREILRAVSLPPGHLDLYPHELSGGQQRRVGLARILTLHPRLIILDEPTSGLDVSVQATILKLFRELQRQFDLTYLFISHDLSVVRMMCDRVVVMYLGRIVETGDTETIFARPRHPYTKSLLAAIPQIGGKRLTEDLLLSGDAPSAAQLPSGCRFRPRCPNAQERCALEEPVLRPLDAGQNAACHFA